MHPGKEETRGRIGGWRKEGKIVVSGYWEVRAIIVRRSLQKVPGSRDECAPERGIRAFEYVPRSSILDEHRGARGQRNVSSKGIFEKLKRYGRAPLLTRAVNYGKTRVTEFMARNSDGYRFKFYSEMYDSENWSLNYDTGSKKKCRPRESVAVSDNGEIEKVYPSVAHAKRRNQRNTLRDKWTMRLQSETCRRKAQLVPARSSEWFYLNEKLRLSFLYYPRFFQASFII